MPACVIIKATPPHPPPVWGSARLGGPPRRPFLKARAKPSPNPLPIRPPRRGALQYRGGNVREELAPQMRICDPSSNRVIVAPPGGEGGPSSVPSAARRTSAALELPVFGPSRRAGPSRTGCGAGIPGAVRFFPPTTNPTRSAVEGRGWVVWVWLGGGCVGEGGVGGVGVGVCGCLFGLLVFFIIVQYERDLRGGRMKGNVG